MKKVYFSFIFTGVFLACEDEGLNRDYPRLITLQVNNITNEGATFNAKIENLESFEVLSYGFAWSELSNTPIDEWDKLILNGSPKGNEISLQIRASLKEGATYFVKPFLETKNYTVFGSNVTFESLGSRPPFISSVRPNGIYYADTITIFGENFSYVESNNRVTVHDSFARVIYATDSLLQAIVPDGVADPEPELTLSVIGRIVSSNELVFNAPTITGLSSTEVVFGDTVSVLGQNLAYRRTSTVSIQEIEISPLSVSREQIDFIVPVGLKEFTVSIVNRAGQFDESETIYIPDPLITELSPDNGSSGDEIIIKGESFGYVFNIVAVHFGAVSAMVSNVTNEQVTVIVPSGIDKEATVEVMVDGFRSNLLDFSVNDL